ncbi:hypothetical protein HCN44_002721 [Aphidius gifuensis]|uniref:Cuticular protein n=1 Tax=Aphidius gifuensis TaxID=684658 RepID=A0A835CPY3_APHGI|nr:dirigent protein 10-like [Aphidius gifuensis]KAF7991159.1 hypothetical protein HCN44_002721 [Aphidius gifuensis]
MYSQIAILLVATIAVSIAAPSGIYGYGSNLAGPVVPPSSLAGPVVGPQRISGAVDGGAVVTGSVAGPSVVSGSVVGGTAVVEQGYGYAPSVLGLGVPGVHGLGVSPLGWGAPALGLGLGHGAVIAGPHAASAALTGAVSVPAVVAGPSGSIVTGYGATGGIARGYYGAHY